MFYALNSSVYLVKGSARSCVYDFNSSKLYSVNKALAEKIDLLNSGEIRNDLEDEELKKALDELVQIGVLILTEIPVGHQIDEIKLADKECKFAWIEVTNKCNLKCRHCYNESDNQCKMSMSLNNYKIVIESLLKLRVPRIQLIGGEPFLCDRKLLKEMLDYTVGKFQLIEIFTNGTLLDYEWVEYLAKNDIHIALSVYSYDKNAHDEVTGCKGSWIKTNEAIRLLKERGVPYRVCNVLMKGVDQGQRTTDLYELSDIKDVVRMSGRASFSLLSEDLIRKKLITPKTFEAPIQKAFVARLLSGHNCFRDKIYVSANMEVFPCAMERRLKHCTIVDEQKGIALDNSIRNLSKDLVDKCACCEYRYACFDCRPNSLSGNVHEKPWYCTYDPMTGEWASEDDFIDKLKEQWGDETKNISGTEDTEEHDLT